MIEQLQQVFRTVFDDAHLIITTSTSVKDIQMWDSLTHLELIAAIEMKFNIRFSFAEVMQFNTVGDILNVIENHLSKTK